MKVAAFPVFNFNALLIANMSARDGSMDDGSDPEVALGFSNTKHTNDLKTQLGPLVA